MAIDEQMQSPGADGPLERYRRWRRYRGSIQTAALKHVSQSTLLEQARRIGMARGAALIVSSESEMSLLYDLAVYGAKEGRTRAIDRYASAQSTSSDPNEALVLKALRESRFSWFRIIARQPPFGVRIEDLLRGRELWLLEEGLERTMQPGSFLAARVAPIECFVMTCGAIVPFDELMALDMHAFLANQEERAILIRQADDRRFPERLYRTAIRRDLMGRVEYR
ncbi:MAG: hypothetical protein AB7F22_17995 [Reyranella sp.]|uniref:hypothetical protein n=1 Tax=Reyranella sp. TaxID=1929291 RepID=UPI003D12822F